MSPERSNASMVLTKVGVAAWPTMAATSLRLAAKPLSNAGTKCSMAMRSNGGIWNGVAQASSSGFCPGGRIFISCGLASAGGCDLAAEAAFDVLCFACLLTMTDLSAAGSIGRCYGPPFRHCRDPRGCQTLRV